MTDIFPSFIDRTKELQSVAGDVSAAYRGTGVGGWALPSATSAVPLKKPITDPTALTPVFDREDVNKAYSEAISEPNSESTVGDIVCLQRQIGFGAVEERAMRTRYMTPARALAHAYGRLDGHSDVNNGVFAKVVNAVQNATKAGGAATTQIGVVT